MNKRILPTTPCPYCHSQLSLRDLIRVPFTGVLRWYQFTPGPDLACPKCGGFVEASANHSPLLLLVFLPPLAALATTHFLPDLRFLMKGLWIGVWALPSLIGLWLLLRSNRLLPKKPRHAN